MGKGLYTNGNRLILEDEVLAESSGGIGLLLNGESQLLFNEMPLPSGDGKDGIFVKDGKLYCNGEEVGDVSKLNMTIGEFNELFSKQYYKDKSPSFIISQGETGLEYANPSNNNGEIDVETDIYDTIGTDLPSFGKVCVGHLNPPVISPDFAIVKFWLDGYAYDNTEQVVSLSPGNGISIDTPSLVFNTGDFFVPKDVLVHSGRNSYDSDTNSYLDAVLNGETNRVNLIFPKTMYLYRNGWETGVQPSESSNVTEQENTLLMASNSSLAFDVSLDTSYRLVFFVKASKIPYNGNTILSFNEDSNVLKQSQRDDSSANKQLASIGFGVKSVEYKDCNNGGQTSLVLGITHASGDMEITEIGVMLWS